MLNKIKKWFINLFKRPTDNKKLFDDILNFIKSQPQIDYHQLKNMKQNSYIYDQCGKMFKDFPIHQIASELSDSEVKFGFTFCKECYKPMTKKMYGHPVPAINSGKAINFVSEVVGEEDADNTD